MRNKLNLLAALAFSALLAGCASVPVPDVATHVDPFSGLRTDLIPDNLIPPRQPASEAISLNASRIYKDFTNYDYYLEVRYEALIETGPLNIRAGSSLVVLADGNEMKFSGSGTLHLREEQRKYIIENALYRVSAEDLRRIAYARSVVVRVIGESRAVEREFGPANFERFVKFVINFVDAGS